MKGNIKAIGRFLAVLLALLSVGMHWGVVVIPMLAGYKFIVLCIPFLLLFLSIVL